MVEKNNALTGSPENVEVDSPVMGGAQEVETGVGIEQNLGSGVGDGGSGGGTEMVVKRKRGRPRKCREEVQQRIVFHMLPAFSASPFDTPPKRGRGRPKGSGKFQVLSSLGGFPAETVGANFTPYVMTVHTGEDVVGKLLSFSQGSSRAFCILSANGVVSSVFIRQHGSSSGTLRYEGRFEILSLSGTFVFHELSAARRRNSILTVSLAKPDGRVFGGIVAGALIAAGPIQLVFGSFKQFSKKELQSKHCAKSPTALAMPGTPEAVRIPVSTIKMTSFDENYPCPKAQSSALSESNPGAAPNIIIEDQNLDATSFPDVDWNTPQPSKPISHLCTSAEIDASIPEI